MEDATAPYNAVYHFRDEHLFEVFVAEIPRSHSSNMCARMSR